MHTMRRVPSTVSFDAVASSLRRLASSTPATRPSRPSSPLVTRSQLPLSPRLAPSPLTSPATRTIDLPSVKSSTPAPSPSSVSVTHTAPTSPLGYAPIALPSSVNTEWSPAHTYISLLPHTGRIHNALELHGVHPAGYQYINAEAYSKLAINDMWHTTVDDLVAEARYGEDGRMGKGEQDPWLESLLMVSESMNGIRQSVEMIDQLGHQGNSHSLTGLKVELVGLWSQLNDFYRDAGSKWWPRVPAPPKSPQVVAEWLRRIDRRELTLGDTVVDFALERLAEAVSEDIDLFGTYPRLEDTALAMEVSDWFDNMSLAADDRYTENASDWVDLEISIPRRKASLDPPVDASWYDAAHDFSWNKPIDGEYTTTYEPEPGTAVGFLGYPIGLIDVY